jgi:hypothetical protein
MKLKTLVACASALVLTASAAQAVHVWEDPSGWSTGHFRFDREARPLFSAQEVSLDLFGSYIAGEDNIDEIFKTDISDGLWGGGVGLNYFMTREFGLGVDANAFEGGGKFIDQVMASAILRLPIESIGLAPYAFGGAGGGSEPDWEWLAHAGVGLEFRLNPGTAIFGDARYIWADDTNDRLQFRAGFRLVL